MIVVVVGDDRYMGADDVSGGSLIFCKQ